MGDGWQLFLDVTSYNIRSMLTSADAYFSEMILPALPTTPLKNVIEKPYL